jgi:hypothetical protein
LVLSAIRGRLQVERKEVPMKKHCRKCDQWDDTPDADSKAACPGCGAIYAKVDAAFAAVKLSQGPKLMAAESLGQTFADTQPPWHSKEKRRPSPQVEAAGLSKFQQTAMWALIVAIVIIFFIGEYIRSTHQTTDTSALEAEQARAKLHTPSALTIAREGLLRTLKDPESAKFGPMRVSRDARAVCGSVNAKNSYGGYSGSQDFLYVLDSGVVVFFIEPSEKMEQYLELAKEHGC